MTLGSFLTTGSASTMSAAGMHMHDELTALFWYVVVAPLVLLVALAVAGLVSGAIVATRSRLVPDGKRLLLIVGSSLAPAFVACLVGCAVVADSAAATARGTNDGRAPLGAGFFLFELPDGGVKLWRDYVAEAGGTGRKDNLIAERLVSVGQSSHYVYGEGTEGFFFWDTRVPRISFAVTSREDLERECSTASIALSLRDPRALYKERRRIWIDIAGWVACFVLIAGAIAAWWRFVRNVILASRA